MEGEDAKLIACVCAITWKAVLATCYEKNVLNEEKKAYETALVGFSVGERLKFP